MSRSPLAVNVAVGLVVAAAGDAACQSLVEGARAVDGRRAAEQGAVRAFVLAPFMSVYFPWLAAAAPGASARAVAARVALDQLVGAPVTIVMTFAALAALRGTTAELPARLAEHVGPAWRTGALFWPAVHSLNFALVPVNAQPLVAHFASVPWTAVLSWRASRRLEDAREGAGEGAGASAGEGGGAGEGEGEERARAQRERMQARADGPGARAAALPGS